MDLALALAAALLFALGTVLQQRVASAASDEEAARAGFLLRLARKPQWLVGIGTDGGGFVCQAGALAAGRLVVVQPVLATSLVFALPIGAWMDHARVGRRDLAGALAVTGGLAVFLVVANPEGGRDDATVAAWVISGAACAGVCVPFLVLARGAGPSLRAALLGSATGVLFGLSAALTKATVERLDGGVVHVLGDWHVWALLVVGYAGMTLSQTSLQAGPLAPAVATQMALDPVASLLLGTLAFEESIHETGLGVVVALAGIAVMVAGIVVLAAGREMSAAHAPPPSPESSASRAALRRRA